MDFFAWLDWIERTGFSTWLRESPSLLAFPSVIVLHTVGLAFLVGTNVAVDLRILGFASRIPLAPMERFFPVMWAGFWVNAASGVALLIAYPAKAFTDPVFYIKLLCIALGVTSIRMIQKQVFGDPSLDARAVPRKSKLLAGASLFFWIGAITAGRLLAYTATRFMAYD